MEEVAQIETAGFISRDLLRLSFSEFSKQDAWIYLPS